MDRPIALDADLRDLDELRVFLERRLCLSGFLPFGLTFFLNPFGLTKRLFRDLYLVFLRLLE